MKNKEKIFIKKEGEEIISLSEIESILKKFNLPIYYFGVNKLSLNNSKHFDSIPELSREAINSDKCVVFVDYLNSSIGINEPEKITKENVETFFKMLDNIRSSKNKFLISRGRDS